MTENGITLLPAIDLRRGRCVRLEQGVAEKETVYRADPVRQTGEFVAQGAEWIHLVDLDAAFDEGSNRVLLGRVAEQSGINVQAGGGLRSMRDLEEVFMARVSRAVIGTKAVEDPEFARAAVERWGPERIVVGLDARGQTPAVRGWREESDRNLFELGATLVECGVEIFLYTDITRDGMMQGPNITTAVELARQTGASVIVSGGVSDMDDLRAVKEANEKNGGISGVVVGKALYEGRVRLSEAIELLKE